MTEHHIEQIHAVWLLARTKLLLLLLLLRVMVLLLRLLVCLLMLLLVLLLHVHKHVERQRETAIAPSLEAAEHCCCSACLYYVHRKWHDN